MTNLKKEFSEKELTLISIALSHLGGQLADDDEKYIGSSEWKFLWNLQEYFNTQANQ
jgi:hypothetical protein